MSKRLYVEWKIVDDDTGRVEHQFLGNIESNWKYELEEFFERITKQAVKQIGCRDDD